ncbi:efflux transporter outer membrane subunit [Sphingobium lactosutens]|uniref:efflux transporter outer membrane subunit n=1 Tax=Sphingobium lactosutens TaxID=522773 RepID=UPI001C4C0EEB|nr:efflux transporter outer membrane subunit [Sphingobium lactosutens]
MKNKTLVALLASASVSACAVGPNYTPPTISAPVSAGFVNTAPDTAAGGEPDTEWWRIYDDPALNALVAQALGANTDLRAAIANLKAADAVVSEARGARLPQTTLSGNATYGRYQSPLFLPGDRFSYGGGAQLSYEVDLFGRVSRTIEAARADADAQAFAKAAVQVRVISAVTDAYLSACTATQAIATLRSSIDLSADSARIIGLQARAGSAATLDVARAEGQAAEARAALAPVENARKSSLLELAALLGLPPSQIPETATRCSGPPQLGHPISVGDGASLLRRRPDVAQAERTLAAASARIGVATGDLYPRISIGGSVNQSGGEGISQSRGFSYGIGPVLSFSFPNITAARARIRQAKGREEAALATFDGTVVTALKEVEQALSDYGAAVSRRSDLVTAEARADQAFRLADQRYRAGSIAYIDAIVAQSELLRLRLARTRADQDVASRQVGIFRALGAGWSNPQAAPLPQTQISKSGV